MLEETGIAIFMFGYKTDNSTGKTIEADGCIQEFEIALEKGNIIIPIGSTGHAARTIMDRVKADSARYPYLKPFISQLENETDSRKIVETVMTIVTRVSSKEES